MSMLKYKTISTNELGMLVRNFISSKNGAMRLLRQEIVEPLKELGHLYVIGGLIRDIAIYGPKYRPSSDIDMVVRCHDADLKKFANKIGAKRNRFGGYGIGGPAYRADFWAYHNTWALKNQFVKMRGPQDLWKATFFDWDAVVYGVSERKVWAIDKYLERINAGRLGINLRPNPSALGSVVRSARRLMLWDARPNATLLHFLEENLKCFDWGDIVTAEKNAFHGSFLDEFESGDEFMERVVRRSSYRKLGADLSRELQLPGMESLRVALRVVAEAPSMTMREVHAKAVPQRRPLQGNLFDDRRSSK